MEKGRNAALSSKALVSFALGSVFGKARAACKALVLRSPRSSV